MKIYQVKVSGSNLISARVRYIHVICLFSDLFSDLLQNIYSNNVKIEHTDTTNTINSHGDMPKVTALMSKFPYPDKLSRIYYG